jgi:hypothetical protein
LFEFVERDRLLFVLINAVVQVEMCVVVLQHIVFQLIESVVFSEKLGSVRFVVEPLGAVLLA